MILEHFSKELMEQQGNQEAGGGRKLDSRNTTMAKAALCFTLAPLESKQSTIALGVRLNRQEICTGADIWPGPDWCWTPCSEVNTAI